MPRPSSTRTSTATSRTTRETIAEARKKLTEAHQQGRHRRSVQNCPLCEKTPGASKSATKAATAGNGRQTTTRKGVTFPPFREVTVVSETYMEVQGQDGETFDLVSCPRCACLIPSTGKATDPAEKAHRAFHELIDSLDQRA